MTCVWMCPQLELMAGLLCPDGEYIDWHMFLLDVAHPWPIATQTELLDTMTRFKELDQKETGYVSQEQYDKVDTVKLEYSINVTGRYCQVRVQH